MCDNDAICNWWIRTCSERIIFFIKNSKVKYEWSWKLGTLFLPIFITRNIDTIYFWRWKHEKSRQRKSFQGMISLMQLAYLTSSQRPHFWLIISSFSFAHLAQRIHKLREFFLLAILLFLMHQRWATIFQTQNKSNQFQLLVSTRKRGYKFYNSSKRICQILHESKKHNWQITDYTQSCSVIIFLVL